MKKAIIILIVAAAAIGLGIYFFLRYKADQELQHPKFYSGNGRLEATEVYISPRLAGRIDKLYVKEGDLVQKGDKLVQMETDTLEAQKAAILAQIKVEEGQLGMAKAEIQRCQSLLDGAKKEYDRNKTLREGNAVSQKIFDETETAYRKALADLEYAKANAVAAEAAIEQQKAELKRVEVDIKDSLLVASYEGRIQYLLAHEGEVISAGGRVLNLVNLTDAYMTFFLPTNVAGLIQMGADVRLVFDAAPEYPLKAVVTYIDPVAQFTPKSVETKVEREKLMFRIKANLNAEMLRKYISDVKTGIPGVAWVKVDPDAKWADSPLKISGQ